MGTVGLLLKIVVWYHQGYQIIIDMSLGATRIFIQLLTERL
ncbi:hypothetical protein ACUXCF_002903 [Enterococcus casseliflavus]